MKLSKHFKKDNCKKCKKKLKSKNKNLTIGSHRKLSNDNITLKKEIKLLKRKNQVYLDLIESLNVEF